MTGDGQPPGSQPPHSFTLYFKEGGVGTFLPLYYSFLSAARGQVRPLPLGTCTDSGSAFAAVWFCCDIVRRLSYAGNSCAVSERETKRLRFAGSPPCRADSSARCMCEEYSAGGLRCTGPG